MTVDRRHSNEPISTVNQKEKQQKQAKQLLTFS